MDTKSTLYNTLKRMIERGQTVGLVEKMDVFCAVGSLSLEDYQELRAMITGNPA